jgi:hypothetical protein
MFKELFIAIISFVHDQNGDDIPIPLPLLPDEPDISEIKCPNQLTNPQNNFAGTLLPRSSNLPSAFCKDISSPPETKCD